jgi:glycosidase
MSTSQLSPPMEFHISRQSRDRYQFDDSLFGLSANAVFANFHAARTFAQKMNAQRDLVRHPERAVKAGQINAMGLIDEILHLMIRQYRMQHNPQAIGKALGWLIEKIGADEVAKTLAQFADEFPVVAVYRQEIHLDDYLKDLTEDVPNAEIILEELILLWLANANPAFAPYLELFDDRMLENYTAYSEIISELHGFFETQPKVGPKQQSLISVLRAPALAAPHSLVGQLAFMQEEWAFELGNYLHQLLSSLDLIREEEKPIFFGPGPAQVYQFSNQEDLFEEERFSPDRDWMPQLVLLAKNAYVWLDQLSKKYKSEITRLDQVPDEELKKLAQWGFSGLWLIGLWERSSASRRIKQMSGNPDAVESAYSLYDYAIANRLGGDESYENLRHRAWQHGIRLAADMVPNHVGIYSKWVVEHPDWFVSLNYSPFPTYTFNGENLSEDQRVGIYLEDHYYTREDAAVVFKRVDQWTGSEKFIYHGNDGTAMPWNDTAQLDYLNPEVREAAIQTILQVARKFQVIRFDAAMTLAKKHFQRLWFPEPGSGGDIPSRSEFGLTKEQFNAAIPIEFWREVVDRVAQEVPDTLLLAEAFWMMEGYFVRTLGMHRVYNSAFMNMLRDEKNLQYRQLIKNTLEFDPQILKRYVNFMNNPDEKTAVEQFGMDDKYFGICILMATMPGLPMFGHGQVEGFHEKYGMEYYRAYWDETPNDYLIQRHKREVFPLLHRRYLFAEVDHFYLFDFFTPEGNIEENVFAYSNRIGEHGSGHCQRSLVIYHNQWANVQGWINTSAAYKDKGRADETLTQINLGNGLGLRNEDGLYTIFKDQIRGLEYIRNNRELHKSGLYIELGAYEYQVFLDFREVSDNEWRQYEQLAEYLQGRGVPNMEEALKEIFLQPLHYPFRELVNPGFFQWLIDNRYQTNQPQTETIISAIAEAEAKIDYLIKSIHTFTAEAFEIPDKIDTKELTAEITSKLQIALQLPTLATDFPLPRSRKYKFAHQLISKTENDPISLADGDPLGWGIIFSWLFTHTLGKVIPEGDHTDRSRKLIDEWLLHKIIAQTLEDLEIDSGLTWQAVTGIKALTTHQNWHQEKGPKTSRAQRILKTWLADPDIQRYLLTNEHQGVRWFNKEALDSLLRWMFVSATIMSAADANIPADQKAEMIVSHYEVISKIQKAAVASEYQIEKLSANIR